MTIPISVGKDNLLHLLVNVNHGANLNFIFDTGADTCVLTELGRAKTSQLKFDGHHETLGSGGKTDQPTASNIDLSIAGRTWTKQSLMFVDYHGSLEADGVIGYNLFSQSVINLDFDRATITVWNSPPPSVVYPTAVNVTLRDGLAFIPIELSTGSRVFIDEFAVDTGFGGTATLTASNARVASLPGNLEQFGSGIMGGTGNGTIEVGRVRLPSLAIAGSSIPDVPIDVQLSESRSFKTWNIVGSELIRRLNFTWDIPGRKMYFAKNRHFADTFNTPPNQRKSLIWIMGFLSMFVTGTIWIRRYRSKK